MRPLEDIICFNFISTITGGHICSDHDQNLLSLPTRLAGFGIPIKTKREKKSSKAEWVIMKVAWIPSHRKKEYQID